nr:tyrosine-type recombinase/integrase [Desulforamulus aquiferis]
MFRNELFISKRKVRQVKHQGDSKMVEKYSLMSGLEWVTPHSFRHTFCKNLANVVDIQTVAALARHHDINTTRIYVDNSYTERINALNKL